LNPGDTCHCLVEGKERSSFFSIVADIGFIEGSNCSHIKGRIVWYSAIHSTFLKLQLAV
jgi:hypothetical protein